MVTARRHKAGKARGWSKRANRKRSPQPKAEALLTTIGSQVPNTETYTKSRRKPGRKPSSPFDYDATH